MPKHYGSTLNLASFGNEHYRAYRETGRQSDYDKAVEYFRMGFEHTGTQEMVRIRGGIGAIELLTLRKRWVEAADILTGCVQLVTRLARKSPIWDWEKLETIMSGISMDGHLGRSWMPENNTSLASTCAAVILNAVEEAETLGDKSFKYTRHDALQYLDLGRSLLSRQAIERMEVDLLRLHYENLATEYEAARAEFHDMATGPKGDISAYGNKTDYDPSVEARYEAVCSMIREKDGFARFHTDPTVAEMQEAAQGGTIVVVNVTEFRSDAFLITKHSVRTLRLKLVRTTVTQLLVSRISEDPRSVGRYSPYLWEQIAQPILEELGLTRTPESQYSQWPRIWWVPTGLLSLVPLHAAGLHAPGSTDTVIDRVVSSYATSVRWLVRSYQAAKTAAAVVKKTEVKSAQDKKPAGITGPRRALLLAMPETPGGKHFTSIKNLPNAQIEVDSVREEVARLGLQPVQPASKTHKECLAELHRCSIFHFAGHGTVDEAHPSRSALLLDDWATTPLTMRELSRAPLEDGDAVGRREREAPGRMPTRFLAYLSACNTAVVTQPSVVDEGLHLVTGMQLAGFSNVVGTLMPVSDLYSRVVAKHFYQALPEGVDITSRDICTALHRSVRALRNYDYRHWSPQRRGMTDLRDVGVAADVGKEVEEIELELNGEETDLGLRFTKSASLDGNSSSNADAHRIRNWPFFVHYGS